MFYNQDMYTSELTYSYTLGMSISIELLQRHPHLVKEVVYSSKIKLNDYYDMLKALCLKYGIPLKEDDRLIRKLSVKENCYVIAFFDKFYSAFATNKILVIEGLKDEGMLGTILRTAVSFGHGDIALVGCDLDYFEPRIVRSSMGAIFYCRIKTYPDLMSFKKEYQDLAMIYINQNAEKEVSTLALEDNYALLFGFDKIKESSYYIANNSVELPLSVQIAITLQSIYH